MGASAWLPADESELKSKWTPVDSPTKGIPQTVLDNIRARNANPTQFEQQQKNAPTFTGELTNSVKGLVKSIPALFTAHPENVGDAPMGPVAKVLYGTEEAPLNLVEGLAGAMTPKGDSKEANAAGTLLNTMEHTPVLSKFTQLAEQGQPLAATGNLLPYSKPAADVYSGAVGKVAAIPKSVQNLMSAHKEATAYKLQPPEVQMTRALNIAEAERPSHIAATQAEAGNIKQYAADNNIPLNSPRDWANAARGAARESQAYYQTKMLAPAANDEVSVAGTGYQGRTVGEGQRATIADIDTRLGQINDVLRSAYQKKEGGQVLTALEKTGLEHEQASLTDLLYGGIAKKTGFTPEQVQAARQRFGRQYSIADQTDAAIGSRERRVDMNTEGRTVPTSKSGALDSVIQKMRGGPEGVASRRFRSALNALDYPAQPLPQAQPVPSHAPTRTPVWQMTPEQLAALKQQLSQSR